MPHEKDRRGSYSKIQKVLFPIQALVVTPPFTIELLQYMDPTRSLCSMGP